MTQLDAWVATFFFVVTTMIIIMELVYGGPDKK